MYCAHVIVSCWIYVNFATFSPLKAATFLTFLYFCTLNNLSTVVGTCWWYFYFFARLNTNWLLPYCHLIDALVCMLMCDYKNEDKMRPQREGTGIEVIKWKVKMLRIKCEYWEGCNWVIMRIAMWIKALKG